MEENRRCVRDAKGSPHGGAPGPGLSRAQHGGTPGLESWLSPDILVEDFGCQIENSTDDGKVFAQVQGGVEVQW